jgi:HAE1 family hydrophobic/amphiphilic exporter-1
VAVTVVYPGASPNIVEREVVEPIEEAIYSIAGLDRTASRTNAVDGLAQFVFVFDFQKGVNEASQDVRDAIGTIRGDLPQEMEEPIITRFDPMIQSALSLSLTSATMDAQTLTRIADPTVVSALRGVNGVAQVNVIGGTYPEMTVELSPSRMTAAGVGVSEIVQAIGAENLAAPVGRLNAPLEERSIRLQGRLATAEEFARLVVAERAGRLVRLGDVAEVFPGFEEQRTATMYNGKSAIGIEVKKSKGYSTTQVVDRVKAALEELAPTLPGDAQIEVVRDQGYRVERSVANVQSALIEGAILTVLVVFLFLNSWRSTVITGLALPISVLASFIAVWAFGFTLNTMSLLGLSLAIGILIDDAIVVRENIVRHVEMGKDHLTAAREGTAEIGLAVAATTFSIVAVFVPIAFMAGISGQWFKPFALTIACAVLVSLFVSFSLDPMLSAYWPDPELAEHQKGWITRRLDGFNRWFDRRTDDYARLIGWALDHRLAMMVLAVGSFAGALFLQKVAGGVAFVPVSDRSEMEVIVEAPPSANLAYTSERAEAVAAIARSHPEVAYTYTTVGNAIPMRTPGVDQGQVFLKLTPKAERSLSQAELGAILRREFEAVAGVEVSVFTGGFEGAIKELQLEIRGPDNAVLTQLATEAATLASAVPGAADVGLSVRGMREELQVELDRGQAASLGLSAGQVAMAMRPAFAGIDAGDWVDPTGETRDVRVRLAPESRSRALDLETLPLTAQGADGIPRVVPLGQVAQVAIREAPAQIDHQDREKVITLEANTEGRALDAVTADVQAQLAQMHWPEGYTVSIGGQGRDQAEVFTSVFTALGIAVLMMYLILVVQFGSFLDPLAILVSLPLSLIGVVVALIITNDTLNIMSLIGVILLMGIVAKNAILLIDFAKWARERQGMPLREALIEAGRIRLRPILMTTFALIAGMVPVALGAGEGADFRAPLGRAVIGGVISSAVLTLVVIPTVYEILDDARNASLRMLARVFPRAMDWAPKTAEHAVVSPES